MTAEGCRVINSLIKSTEEEVPRAVSSFQIKRKPKVDNKNNPLIIYPFENKLKPRRVDDNIIIL